MLLSAVAAGLMLFILGVSAHFYMPVSGLFFILNHSGILARTYSKSPQYGVPTRYHSIAGFISILVFTTYHPRELPYTLHSEILYLPINPWTAIHIYHFHSCNLIFLLSLFRSLFICHFRKDALNQGSLLKNSFLRQSTPDCTLPTFSLSAIYRCVARSCHKVIKQNLYHRKSSCIPHLSKYSCLAFSRSSSVGAVLNVVYN